MESDRAFLRDDSSQYIAALSNFATSCGYQGAYQEMRNVLEKLKKVKPQTTDDQLKIHRQYYNNYFGLCINTGSFKEGLKVLQQHLQDVKKLDKSLFEHSSFYFQYFYIYFGTEDYDQALNYLNEWLNLPRSVDQQDLQHLARLLNLIVHFEMDNTLLLTSLLRSTQRNLQKKGRYNAFEQLFIQCLKHAHTLPSYREQQKVFATYLQKLTDLEISPRDRATLRFFDFNSWLKSKATRTSFAEVVRSKA
jgi:tetratricopeptide (TPR) repeat protein